MSGNTRIESERDACDEGDYKEVSDTVRSDWQGGPNTKMVDVL